MAGYFTWILSYTRNTPISLQRSSLSPKIYHLNISFNGDLCLEILGQYWIPAIRIAGVLENIRAMLLVPNSDKPYEWEIGNLYKTNLKEYFDKERMDEKICVSI